MRKFLKLSALVISVVVAFYLIISGANKPNRNWWDILKMLGGFATLATDGVVLWRMWVSGGRRPIWPSVIALVRPVGTTTTVAVQEEPQRGWNPLALFSITIGVLVFASIVFGGWIPTHALIIGVGVGLLFGAIARGVVEILNAKATGGRIPVTIVMVTGLIVGALVSSGISVSNILGAISALGAGSMLVKAAGIVTPLAHRGAILRRQRRTGFATSEGQDWIWPVIETTEPVSYKLKKMEVAQDFMAADDWEVLSKGLLQWQPNLNIRDKFGHSVFLQVEEETIQKGLLDKVRSVIGNIIGTTEAMDFKSHKSAVERYIRCVLQMEMPPHAKSPWDDVNSPPRWTKDKEVERKFRLAFYHEMADKIRDLMDTQSPDKYSEVEKLYGIDVVDASLSDIDYSENSRSALEGKKQAEEKMKAADVEAARAFGFADKARAYPEAAMNAGLILSDKVSGQVVMLQGGGGTLPIFQIPSTPVKGG